MSFEELTEDEFEQRFTPMQNHLNDNACWNGCLFQTPGEELAFVRQQDPRRVWTLVANDDEAEEAIDDNGDGYLIRNDYILSGFHWTDRIGYFISEQPVPDDIDIEVRIHGGE